MAGPKYSISVRLDPIQYERLQKLARAQNATLNSVLVRLIGCEEDDATSRRAQTSVRKVKA